MKTINIRSMVEGAILAALTAILGIFYNVPVVGAITMFWPVPIIIVGYRNGFRVSMIAAFVAALLVSLITTPVVGIILFVTYAIPGAVMGYMLRKRYSLGVTIALCGALLTVTAVLQLALSLELLLGIDIIHIVRNFDAALSSYFNGIYKQVSDAAVIYKQYGMNEADIKDALEKINIMLQQTRLLLPAGFLLTGIITSYINFKMVKLILGRIGYKLEDFKRFSEWRLNKKYRYIILGITFIVLLLMSMKVQFLSNFYTNTWILLWMLYTVLGLSVIVYFKEKLGEKYEIPKPLQSLMLFFLALIMLAILPYIGMLDIAADVRRLDSNIHGGVR